MSNDLISRQAAIDALCRGEGCKNVCRQALEHLPSVQPEIVRCEECVYRRRCMLQHFVISNAVEGRKIDWSEWYCADGVRDDKVDESNK